MVALGFSTCQARSFWLRYAGKENCTKSKNGFAPANLFACLGNARPLHFELYLSADFTASAQRQAVDQLESLSFPNVPKPGEAGQRPN